MLRVSADVTANVMVGAGPVGARGDDFRVTTGLVWAPQPAGAAAPGRDDRDGDGVPDSVDGCPEEAEDKDGFQDEDGCPDRRQRRRRHRRRRRSVRRRARGQGRLQGRRRLPRATTTTATRSPTPPTSAPTRPRTSTASRTRTAAPTRTTTATASPTRSDAARTMPRPSTASTTTTAAPTSAAPPAPRSAPIASTSRAVRSRSAQEHDHADAGRRKQLLNQVATLIKSRKLHDPHRGPRAARHQGEGRGAIRAAEGEGQDARAERGKAIVDYLVAQGVAAAADPGRRPRLGSSARHGDAPTDPINERVDFIKAQQQGGTP